MKTKLWYGIKNNDVRFAETETALIEQGINSPQSFEVGSNGVITGLNFETGTGQHQSQGQQPTG